MGVASRRIAGLEVGQRSAKQLQGHYRSDTAGLESGWVRMEYEKILQRRAEDPDFRLIPVVLGEEVGLPFLKNVLWVDFSQDYRTAFYRLLCGLRDQSPGSEAVLEREVILPEDASTPTPPNLGGETAFLDGVFEELRFRNPAVLVLAQADKSYTSALPSFLKRAQHEFGQDKTLHLMPLRYGLVRCLQPRRQHPRLGQRR